MGTEIGRALRKRGAITWLAAAIAAVAVASDLSLAALRHGYDAPRIALAGVSVCALALLGRGDRCSLGLTFRLNPSYRYWVRATLLIGAIVGLFCLVAFLLLHAAGVHIPIPATPPDQAVSSVVFACIAAPLLEEAIYRLVFCVPFAAITGTRTTIMLSGAIFAGLHFVYGNPSPDNFIAGFFLAWAYLKSGSIFTPLLLHSLGNACAVAAHIVHWYMTS